MPCGYYNESKDNVYDGIYCNKIGGRPGNDYWRNYCDGCYSDCPHNGGRDPAGLHPDTRERMRVEDQIRNLPGRVTVDDERAIENARWAFDRLSYQQQAFVENRSKLESAERALSDAKYQKRYDDAAVEKVVSAIDRIPGSVTKSDGHLVREARRLYHDLDYGLKKQVRNLSRLENAERQLEIKVEEEKQRERQEEQDRWNPSPTEWDARDDDDDRQRKGGGTGGGNRKQKLRTGSAIQRLLESVLDWMCDLADPRMRLTPWWIKGIRVALPISILIFRYATNCCPDYVWNTFLVLSCFMLGSLITSYVATYQPWVRGFFWLGGLISLAVLVFMVYQLNDPLVYQSVLCAAALYPLLILLFLIGKAVCAIIEFFI